MQCLTLMHEGHRGCINYIQEKFKLSSVFEKNPAYGQHSALLYVCDSGLEILYHESKSIPWVLSITRVHVYTISACQFQEVPKVQEVPIDSGGT